jgi:hypothetical protein
MIKLDNHRLLKAGEIIRKGDFYKNKHDGEVRPVKFSINREVGSGGYANYDFYRRKHTKKVAPVTRPVAARPVVADKQPVAKYPTVNFKYNGQHREVQVIALTDRYISGLEVTREGFKPSYQFKKFLRSRLQTGLTLVALADK